MGGHCKTVIAVVVVVAVRGGRQEEGRGDERELREVVSNDGEKTKSDPIWISVVSTSGPTDVS